MKISKFVSGLSPELYVGKKALFSIVDIHAEQRNKKDMMGHYVQFSLDLLGASEGYIGDFQIKYLFDRDLNRLIEAYGEETDAWKGKLIEISAKAEGQYFRWVLLPNPSL